MKPLLRKCYKRQLPERTQFQKNVDLGMGVVMLVVTALILAEAILDYFFNIRI